MVLVLLLFRSLSIIYIAFPLPVCHSTFRTRFRLRSRQAIPCASSARDTTGERTHSSNSNSNILAHYPSIRCVLLYSKVIGRRFYLIQLNNFFLNKPPPLLWSLFLSLSLAMCLIGLCVCVCLFIHSHAPLLSTSPIQDKKQSKNHTQDQQQQRLRTHIWKP